MFSFKRAAGTHSEIYIYILILLICTITAKADLWRTGYYPAYNASAMPTAEIDFSALTHIVHFSVFPNGDGSLATNINGITPQNTASLVTAAHNANVKVLICVGGAGSYFPNAASGGNLGTFVLNLTNFMARGNYDGIDVDWEPLSDGDTNVYANFIVALRSALNGFSTHKILATAVPPSTTPAAVARVQGSFDQVNLMTYDYSGPYDGWVTWFNSPLYDGGYTFPAAPTELVPSTDATLTNFLTAGISASKLGIGLAFYGDIWAAGNDGAGNGMQTPRESWTAAPTNYTVTYNQIVSSNFPAGAFNYDAVAQSAWIGINGTGTNDMFISYDSTRTCQAKVSYARNHGLGGLIIWELTQDHHSGQTDPLLQAVKQAIASPGATTALRSGTNVNLAFASMPLGAYRVQTSTNLAGAWSTLVVTNVALTATGGVIQVSDPVNRPARFYRVQTPP